jgi:AmiR/NasT family two-component response regulator
VLTIAASTAGALGEGAEQAGWALATHAALTVQAIQRNRQFRTEMGSRDIVGQAKGMLMVRFGIGAADASAVLAQLSQKWHQPLVIVAMNIIEEQCGVRGR